MPTDLAAIQTYLNTHIPITRALGVEVREANQRVVLWAPIENNINHKSTVFGGSLQAVATLACWTLLHQRARPADRPSEIVISHSNIDYILPVTGDFEVVAHPPEPADWDRFMRSFERHGRARIRLEATIHEAGRLAVAYVGQFVLLAPRQPN